MRAFGGGTGYDFLEISSAISRFRDVSLWNPHPLEECVIAKDDLLQRVESCFDECARPAWRLAYAYLQDATEAYDVVQQAFVVAASKPEQVPQGRAWPWFSAVVLNEARNARRKKRPAAGVLDEERIAAMPDQHAAEPSAALADRETHQQLRVALRELPDVEREAVVLTHLCELSHRQAAHTLDVPRQTLTARVQRGLRRLQERLGTGSDDAAVAGSLAVLPLAVPPGGWDRALGLWRGETIATVQSTLVEAAVAAQTSSGATLGGIAMAKKTALILSTTVALGVGLMGGALMQSQRGAESTAAGDAGGADATVADSSLDSGVTDGAAKPERGSTRTALQARNTALQTENKQLKDRLTRLEQQLATTTSEAAPGTGPVFTFGAVGQLPGVLEANWAEMAAADLEVAAAILEIRDNAADGIQTPKTTYLALQENVEKMRKYEYRTIGSVPTVARHNGELTHPVSIANLMAAQLTQLGHPLTDDQVQRINGLGVEFEANFARQRAAYSDGTLKVTQLLDEYLIKGEFVDDLHGLLTTAQKDVLVDPRTHRIAFLDLHCPSLMIIHSSPIILASTTQEIRQKVQEHVTKQYALTAEQAPQVAPLLDAWLQSCSELVAQPVPRHDGRHYTYDDSVLAGEATVELLTQLLRAFPNDPDLRDKIVATDGFLVPRLVEPNESQS
ncbi:MAG: sigma-70 family RNA polymerase sigma factor [Planctomycetota bacterium]